MKTLASSKPRNAAARLGEPQSVRRSAVSGFAAFALLGSLAFLVACPGPPKMPSGPPPEYEEPPPPSWLKDAGTPSSPEAPATSPDAGVPIS